VEVLKGVAYLLAFVTALRVARRKDGVTFLSGVIMATALVLRVRDLSTGEACASLVSC
jgi:hypothetical protein